MAGSSHWSSATVSDDALARVLPRRMLDRFWLGIQAIVDREIVAHCLRRRTRKREASNQRQPYRMLVDAVVVLK